MFSLPSRCLDQFYGDSVRHQMSKLRSEQVQISAGSLTHTNTGSLSY